MDFTGSVDTMGALNVLDGGNYLARVCFDRPHVNLLSAIRKRERAA